VSAELSDTLIKLMAAWLLLLGAALWARREGLGLSKRMLVSSLRGLAQLLILAFILHWVFDIQSHMAQGMLILAFCVMAGRTSAGHHPDTQHAWLAASIGLASGCLVTLPWLAISGAINDDTRTLIPLGSMVAANGMNAVSIMFERQASSGVAAESMRTAMIPNMDTLRVVGLVHMPGIFVGMTLAGSPPLAAASAQLVVLYMIVASSFTACMVSFLMMNHLDKGRVCA